MAVSIGEIGEFNAAMEYWSSYLERLNHYFAANKVENEQKKDAFLCCIGRDTYMYGLLRALMAPNKPAASTYKQLTDALTAHLVPKPIVIAKRFRFHKRNQMEGETIKSYVAIIQKLAEDCAFGTSLSDTLRDRLVCGMRDEKVHRHLLSRQDLTFKQAVDEAEIAERAAKDAAQFHETDARDVHRLLRQLGHCYRCNGNHDSQQCRFINEQCKYCKKRGHIKRPCRTKKREHKAGASRRAQGAVKTLEGQDSTEDKETVNWGEALGMEQWKEGKPLYMYMYVEVSIEGQCLKMELNTEASLSTALPNIPQMVFPLAYPQTKACLKTYTGEKLYPHGQITVNVRKGGSHSKLPQLVVDRVGPLLLGRNLLHVAEISVNWDYIKAVTVENKEDVERERNLKLLLSKYPNLVKDSIGVMKEINGHLSLKNDAKPVFLKARPVPYSLRTKVEDELTHLEKAGIITPVTWSNWATPIVVVPKPDGSVRLCDDFKVTLNPALNVDKYPLPLVEDIFAALGGSSIFSKIDLHLAYFQMEMDETSKELLIINTQKGVYQFNRLAFGIASVPAIWQRAIDTTSVTGNFKNSLSYR